jgi:glycosyltransferase involved in cell wall biosynthesis
MTTDQPLVSIITPVYNGAKYLEKLIESVQMQDYHNIEHVIIDDGSTDDDATVAILRKYPHLRWWSRENKGQYATMNEGLETARGELVCFISADDMMAPGAVRCAVEFMQAHPNYEGVYGAFFWIDENGAHHRAQNIIDHAPLKLFRYYTFISHASLYVRKDYLLMNVLRFDASLRYVGDYDWILRIIESGAKIGYAGKFFSFLRSHQKQTSNRNAIAMSEERNLILRRHSISPFVFSLVYSTAYWYSALTRLIKAIHKKGPKGAFQLIHDWQQRKSSRRL